MAEPRCETCRFYQPSDGWNECWRFPPDRNGFRAEVMPDDFCGEHTDKESKRNLRYFGEVPL